MILSAIFDMLIRNWAIVAISATVVVLVLVPTIITARYIHIALNIMRSTKPPLARSPLDFEPLQGEPVAFTAFDGMRLNGMLIKAPHDQPRRGLIVFAHEFCSDLWSCARYCRPLWEAGYDIFTFDFRNQGQSESEPHYTPRQWVSDREIADIRGALAFSKNWLEERGLPRRIGVFGVSRGGCAGLLAAAEDDDIAAIAVDGAFSTDRTLEYLMERWAYIFARVRLMYEPPVVWRFLRWILVTFARFEFRCSFPSVRKAVARLSPRPVLFIHGERDSYLPVEQSRLLYALAPQPKFLWIAPGARHNQAVIVHPQRYAALSARFFNRYLAGLEERAAQEPAVPPTGAYAPPPGPASPHASTASASQNDPARGAANPRS